MKPDAPPTKRRIHVIGTFRWHPAGVPQSGTPTHPGGSEQGQGVVEYGLMFALMALVAVLALALFGPQVSAIINTFAK
jgi:Flp pilus assembly pilin Flp